MSFVTSNKKIAVEPFPAVDAKPNVVGGRVVIKSDLVPLKTVFGSSSGIEAERTVYVRGDLRGHQLAKDIFELEGKKFILIDETMVVGYVE